ncbi:AP-4 complex subunit epsilon (AP-4 adaptor complex subunit epsilon) (Adaptor-related protein complex 4 subunit epsilon) (Epsilon subunit of AP-4) (Epsilon-adaptin) [Durusdinium trenchii]|uniref:AP-4 complex subunit epsilon (AP-4 adaptor complex subunit epsilon) (Adaptor-related protein complex 4 subunit epsilon) (Epsilon subunit of AP-4) (Epsilon-adaptin) n=1 Tax=Durusdinium trenchii TaxID=1381693 RepID=A0ABP0ITV3_9DINO
MSGSHLSKDFFDLVKSIGESKSKQEEDRIIVNEVRTLKARFMEKNLTKKVIKESLIRLIYVEMLGHDASFAYVHAIQLTAAGDLMQKKVGYLTASLTLSPDDEFRFMLVNQMQRDLASANILEVSTALVALSKLITNEMIPALLPSVSKLLNHDQHVVRKKAVLALHRIYQLDPDAVAHMTEAFRRMLADKDPSVMAAALCLMHELMKEDPQSQKDLVASYVSILRQIVEHRLPKDFDYHRIPAPWIQIKLLKLLATLGENDQRTSEQMYSVLSECIKRANTGIYVGYAIIYECVRTVTTIYPNEHLLDAAAASIAKFIQSDSHNLKYLGVTGLAAIVRDHPRYAAEHQMVVLDCLEDPDETLKRKTLDLLFRMTNPVNAEVVVDKLVYFLKDAVDKFLRQDLVTRICQLAERFAPSNLWYIRTITKVFELGGDLVETEVAHNLLRLLAEGAGEGEGEEETDRLDEEMRREACEIFLDNFERPILPDILLRVMFWTLGEYAFLMGAEMVPEVLEVICEAGSRQGMSPDTRGYAVSAVMKMCAQLGKLPPDAADLIDKYSGSLDVDLQQKCYEFRELARNMDTMTAVLPVDASCEDLAEPDFGFLDGFVQEAIANGAEEYNPPTQDEEAALEYDDDDYTARPMAVREEPSLKYDAYEKPAPPSHFVGESTSVAAASAGTYNPDGSRGPSGAATGGGPAASGLNLSGVKSVWGSSGYAGSLPAPGGSGASAAAAAAAASAPDGMPTSIAIPDHPPPVTAPPERQQTPPPSIVQAAPEPPKPKEPTERERQAAALFGGVTSSAPAPARASSRRKPGAGLQRNSSSSSSSSTQPPAAAAPQPPQPSPVDLLGFDGFDASAGASSPAQQDQATLDLLSVLDDSSPAAAAAAAPGPAPVEDLMGGPVEVAAAPPSKPYAPLQINTQEFGQRWVSTPGEVKVTSNFAQAQSVHDMVGTLTAALGLHSVEVIAQTEEAIFAGTDAQTGADVLVHCKRRSSPATMADLTVRAASPPVAQALVQHCRRRESADVSVRCGGQRRCRPGEAQSEMRRAGVLRRISTKTRKPSNSRSTLAKWKSFAATGGSRRRLLEKSDGDAVVGSAKAGGTDGEVEVRLEELRRKLVDLQKQGENEQRDVRNDIMAMNVVSGVVAAVAATMTLVVETGRGRESVLFIGMLTIWFLHGQMRILEALARTVKLEEAGQSDSGQAADKRLTARVMSSGEEVVAPEIQADVALVAKRTSISEKLGSPVKVLCAPVKRKKAFFPNKRRGNRRLHSAKIPSGVVVPDPTASQEGPLAISERSRHFVKTTQEMNAITLLRKRLENVSGKEQLKFPLDLSDMSLFTFVKSTDLNVDLAEKMFRRTLAWRKSRKPEVCYADLERAPHPVTSKYMTGTWAKWDKDGAPVMYDRIGQLDLPNLMRTVEPVHIENFHIWKQETHNRLLEEAEARTGRPHHQVVVLLDMQGLSFMKHFNRNALNIVKVCVQIDSQHYPERLKKMVIFNAGACFASIWNVVRHFLDPRTCEKIKIFKNVPSDYLLTLIDKENLPKALGGDLVDPVDGHPYCPSLINPGGPIPKTVPRLPKTKT